MIVASRTTREGIIPSQNRSIPYRADLDGLRGIAILMVVYFHNFEMYHFVPTQFGFFGVDIFFVLSGYLITHIINTSLDKGSFSFAAFYARRVQRLFPALIAVFCMALAWGWFVMDPFFFQHLGSNIFYGALSLANVTFAPDAGFFDVQRTIKPFIPLWSLSLEWQFYALIPALLKWLRPLRTYRWIPFFLFACVSFFIQSEKIPSPIGAATRYYDPFSRFWELLVGVILALVMPNLTRITQSLFERIKKHTFLSKISFQDTLSWLGAYAILGTVLVTDSQDHLPFKTFWVCLGTGLLIMAGPTAWMNQKILSHRLLVAIGLISYPLYLVHWFLISMISITQATNHHAITLIMKCYNDPMIMVLMTLSAIALSVLMYRYVEKPLRYSRRTFLLCAIMGTLALSGGLAFFQKWRPLHRTLWRQTVSQTALPKNKTLINIANGHAKNA